MGDGGVRDSIFDRFIRKIILRFSILGTIERKWWSLSTETDYVKRADLNKGSTRIRDNTWTDGFVNEILNKRFTLVKKNKTWKRSYEKYYTKYYTSTSSSVVANEFLTFLTLCQLGEIFSIKLSVIMSHKLWVIF